MRCPRSSLAIWSGCRVALAWCMSEYSNRVVESSRRCNRVSTSPLLGTACLPGRWAESHFYRSVDHPSNTGVVAPQRRVTNRPVVRSDGDTSIWSQRCRGSIDIGPSRPKREKCVAQVKVCNGEPDARCNWKEMDPGNCLVGDALSKGGARPFLCKRGSTVVIGVLIDGKCSATCISDPTRRKYQIEATTTTKSRTR